MKAYKCDRCGAYTTHKLYEVTFERFLFKPVYELCEDCREDFLKWFKQEKNKTENEENSE